ncbi:tyrosine-type recombinase/integrase [Gordonia oryzae]|uniref:tyrosine-type recombinase/integrase n=1 Tax=Gordonia oryzae TaxID=2487349 RepID=UPI003F83745D
MPLAEWLERWKKTKGGAPNTVATRDIMIRLHILPYFGAKPLSTISPSDVETWSQHLVATISTHTARQALVPLRQAFKLAVRDSFVVRDPTQGVRLPKARPNEPMPLSHDQVWDLYEAAPRQRDAVMFVTMAYSGTRWGELSAMTSYSVRGNEVRLTHAYSEVSGHLHIGELKDHESRSVPLPSTVGQILGDWAKPRSTDQLCGVL